MKNQSHVNGAGIYILKFSKHTIKIGRSSNLEKRLESYRGSHRLGK